MICKMCRNKFRVEKEPGAILISPPFQSRTKFPVGDMYRKEHICKKCFGILIRWICLYHNKRKTNDKKRERKI